VSVLRGGLTTNAKTGKARNIGTGRRYRSLPGLEKHRADARGFFFGKTAFLGRIASGRRHWGRRDGLATVLRVEDRAAEIAGQGRPQDGSGIVARQAGQTVRRGAVLG